MSGRAVAGRAEAGAGYRWVVLGISLLALASSYLGGMAPPPLAAFFQADLGITRAQVGLFTTAFALGGTVTLIPFGWLGDRFGVRGLFLVGLALVGGWVVGLARAGSFAEGFAALFLAGLGGGMISPSTTKAVMDWFPSRSRGMAMGVKQTGTAWGGLLAAALLPSLALALGWRGAFFVLGLVIMAAGIISFALYRDYTESAASPVAMGARGRGLSQVLMDRDIIVLSAVALFLAGAQLTVTTYLALYLKEVFLLPVVLAGGYLALAQGGGVLGRVVWGIVSDRLCGGRRKGVILALGMGFCGAALVMGEGGPALPGWALFGLVLALGMTAWGWTGLFMTYISELAGRERSGTAAGLGLTACNVGILSAPPLFGLLVDLSGSYGLAWRALAACAGVGTSLLLFVRERK